MSGRPCRKALRPRPDTGSRREKDVRMLVFCIAFLFDPDYNEDIFLRKRGVVMKRFSLKIIGVVCAALICLTAALSSAPDAFAATVYLRGTFNGWEARPEYAMTYENGRYLITVPLNKGSYDYKAATNDWSTFQAPVQGNESLSLDSAGDVTFIAYADSNIIEAYPQSSLEADVKKAVLRSKWMEHSDLVLVEKNSAVAYQSAAASYPDAAYWNILSDGSGAYYLQNNATKHYAALSGSRVVCVASADGGNTGWKVDTTMGAARFISTANANAVINIEQV